jgi:uncharacterized protein (DUF1697 family)
MPRYAILLRGVNVGGNRKVAMGDLRELLESLGHTEVSTHLQSGNAILSSSMRSTRRLGQQIEKALAADLGVDTRVLVWSAGELAAVVEANPFPESVRTPKHLHVAFLSEQPGADQAKATAPDAYAPDEFRFGDRVVYLRYADGSQGSKLDRVLIGLKGVATTRNWNTVEALARKTSGG